MPGPISVRTQELFDALGGAGAAGETVYPLSAADYHRLQDELGFSPIEVQDHLAILEAKGYLVPLKQLMVSPEMAGWKEL